MPPFAPSQLGVGVGIPSQRGLTAIAKQVQPWRDSLLICGYCTSDYSCNRAGGEAHCERGRFWQPAACDTGRRARFGIDSRYFAEEQAQQIDRVACILCQGPQALLWSPHPMIGGSGTHYVICGGQYRLPELSAVE